MKKILLAIALIACVCTNGYAKKSALSVESGKNIFKGQCSITLAIDFSSTTWEDDGPLAQVRDDSATIISRANDGLSEGLVKNNGKIQIVKDGQADYNVVYKVDMIEQHQNFGEYGGRLAGRSNGTITVTDASGATVCIIKVNGLAGQADWTMGDRFYKAFEILGWQLTKLK